MFCQLVNLNVFMAATQVIIQDVFSQLVSLNVSMAVTHVIIEDVL